MKPGRQPALQALAWSEAMYWTSSSSHGMSCQPTLQLYHEDQIASCSVGTSAASTAVHSINCAVIASLPLDEDVSSTVAIAVGALGGIAVYVMLCCWKR